MHSCASNVHRRRASPCRTRPALEGIATGVGLALLGVPLAPSLGVVAALLDIVPFIGPLVSGTFAVLIAFLAGPMAALYTALLVLAIQQVEGNVLVPLAQRWAVRMPPALGLVAVVAAAQLFGWGGVFLATPLALVAAIAIRKLYVEPMEAR